MEGNNNDADGVLSPEMKSIIKRLEEEMDDAEKDFNKETELEDDHSKPNEALDESIFSEERQGHEAELDIQQMILVADQTTDENNAKSPPTLTPRRLHSTPRRLALSPPLASSSFANSSSGSSSTEAEDADESLHTVILSPPVRHDVSDTEKGLTPDTTTDHSMSSQDDNPNKTKSSLNLVASCVACCKCVGACLISCWATLALVVSTVARTISNTTIIIVNSTKDCFAYHRHVISSTPAAVRIAVSWASNMKKGQALCLVSIVTSVFTSIYPTSPFYNIFIAMLIFLFQIKPMKWVNSQAYHSIALIIIVIISVCVDIDWLSYKYYPTSLNEEGELAYRLKQETSLVYSAAWYALLINIFLKLFCLNEALKSNKHGRNIRQQLLGRFGRCCISRFVPKNLSAAVKDKVVALAWIEFICSLLCFACFFVIEFDTVSSSLFWNVSGQIFSLQATLLYKGLSGGCVLLSFAHHITMKDAVAIIACHGLCPGLVDDHRSNRETFSSVGKSSCCIIMTKLFDLSFSVLLWMALVSVYNKMGFDAPKDVNTFNGVVLGTLIFTSIISPILIVVMFFYIRLSKHRRTTQRRRRRHRHRRKENTPRSGTPSSRDFKSRLGLNEDGNTPFTPNKFLERGSLVDDDDDKDYFELTRRPSSSRSQRSNRRSHTSSLHYDEERGSANHDKDDHYNLTQPSRTQSLFESRLTGASATTRSPSTPITEQTNDLELCTCTPSEFQSAWRSFDDKGLIVSHQVLTMPTLSDIHKHFYSRRFHVVASGQIGYDVKLFVVGQRRISKRGSLRNALSRCLVEITIDSLRRELNAEVRCRNHNDVHFFVSKIGLSELGSR